MADKKSEQGKAEGAGGISKFAAAVMDKADKIKYTALAALAVLLAIVIIFSYLRSEKAANEARAEAALYKAEMELGANPASADAFAKLAAEYAGLPAGAKALIINFSHAFNTRDFQEAERSIADFLKTYPRSVFVSRARLALGQTQLMLGKTTEAEAVFRQLAAARAPEAYPEAKLALAQTLERLADEVKDQPDEYRRRLELAAEECSDIVGQAQSPLQRSFWPQAVVLPADFELTLIRDKLAGHEHQPPYGKRESAADAPVGVDLVEIAPPPAESAAGTPSAAEIEDVEQTLTEEAEAAAEAVAEARAAAGETPDALDAPATPSADVSGDEADDDGE